VTDSAVQNLDSAAESFMEWLDRQVLEVGRGDRYDRFDVAPAATFWLGRLASEEEVRNNLIGERAERLDPCAVGIRVRPAGDGPWRFRATTRMRAWVHDAAATDSGTPWRRSDVVNVETDVHIDSDGSVVAAADELARALADVVGAAGLTAEIRADVETWSGVRELVVQLVNTSPESHPGLKDTHLYETVLEIEGLDTVPFELEQLPDAFRYDRRVPAYGINVGVRGPEGVQRRFRTVDTVTVTTRRPKYWNSPSPEPDLSFGGLARDPLPALTALVEALCEYNEAHWSAARLDERAGEECWDEGLRDEAAAAAQRVLEEQQRLRAGLALLHGDDDIRRAFCLMNDAIRYSSAGRGYDRWRAFQIGFLLQALPFLEGDPAHADVVDTVWFATGGGKTETYLGLLVTAALHDRLTGKSSGITAWSRFPLRLLSLQQTQRFADALAGAERVRREAGIRGAPFSLGFLVGAKGTPNKVVKEAVDGHPDPDSDGMPDRYQVLMHCPFCRSADITMRFDRRFWRLVHTCGNADCPWPEQSLPFYIVDQEIYRFLPTVVLGTLDKAASIGMQAAMRGLVGPPLGMCTEPGHGYTYAPRSKTPNGCLVPDCPGGRRDLPMDRRLFAPTLRLQDELHLLRDSLGAVDSHYESLLDHLQHELGGRKAKIIASSATLTGYERQVDVLYGRTGRVFPQPGPKSGESFWSAETDAALRRFVAVAPRGVTLEHVTDRSIDVLQQCVRRLQDEPDIVCAEAGVDPRHAQDLLSLYGTDVVYGSTLHEVEAAERSLASNSNVGSLNSVQLTGQTDFDEVREVLDRLETPEADFSDRVHVVAASSMLSHGVDVSRLNVMVMLGLPLGTAEFIQTSARVGRSKPGLVHVLHKIGRERDAQTFRQFEQYVRQGDRFVEPIPVSRRSRRVLRLTIPGIVEARRLALLEPRSPNQRLTTLKALREFAASAGMTPAAEAEHIATLLRFDGPVDGLLRDEIRAWLRTWFVNLEDPASTAKWPNQLGPDQPMTSLRDVEASAPIHD
jgi:hypothetical protein